MERKVLSTTEGDMVHYFYLKLVDNSVRLGNCEGRFGIGDMHGDALGEYVYKVDFAKKREVSPQLDEADERVEDPEIRRQLDGINRQIGELNTRMNEIKPRIDQIHARTVDIEFPDAPIDESQFTPEERTLQTEWDHLRSQIRPLSIQRMRLTQQLYRPSASLDTSGSSD